MLAGPPGLGKTTLALILANEFLEYELCEMFKAVTNGPGKFSGDRADWFD